jgi:hypothetical protein
MTVARRRTQRFDWMKSRQSSVLSSWIPWRPSIARSVNAEGYATTLPRKGRFLPDGILDPMERLTPFAIVR